MSTMDNVVENLFVNLTHVKIGSAEIYSSQANRLGDLIESYMNSEELDRQIFLKCGRCGYGQCLPGTIKCTIKEERELLMITKGLQFNEEEKRWNVVFPWIKDPKEL